LYRSNARAREQLQIDDKWSTFRGGIKTGKQITCFTSGFPFAHLMRKCQWAFLFQQYGEALAAPVLAKGCK
jgi:hypothetical protein